MALKLERLIFFLFLFSIPIQARLIVYQWTRPFNEWTAGFIYGTDILLVTLLILWRRRATPKRYDIMIYHTMGEGVFLLVFLLISALSIFSSEIPGLSFYRLIKLAEFILFYFYLKANLGRVFDLRIVATAIVGSGLFQAVVAIIQYLKQGSLGLKVLGESPIGIDVPNVAVFLADGQKFLRAYGTTPHPNVLAAWLLVAIFAFYFWYLNRKVQGKMHEETAAKAARGEKSALSFYHDRIKIIVPIYVVLLFGFFFTFSRVVVGLWVVTAAAGFLMAGYRRKVLAPLAVTTLVTAAIFILIFWPQVSSRIHLSLDEEAVSQRAFYNKIASSVVLSKPLLGIGIGQFVADLMTKYRHYPSNFYQPVHNIYLLILSETGILGLASMLAFAGSIYWGFMKRVNSRPHHFLFLIFSFSFLLIGLFDHFLWTLQPGSLMLWLVLALLSLPVSVDPVRGNPPEADADSGL